MTVTIDMTGDEFLEHLRSGLREHRSLLRQLAASELLVSWCSLLVSHRNALLLTVSAFWAFWGAIDFRRASVVSRDIKEIAR